MKLARDSCLDGRRCGKSCSGEMSSNIGPEVPPENVLAMYDAFEHHRNYPAR